MYKYLKLLYDNIPNFFSFMPFSLKFRYIYVVTTTLDLPTPVKMCVPLLWHS